MKKYVSAFLMLFVLLSFVSCGQSATVADDGRLSVVTTIFPVYDWTKNVVGDKDTADVTMLLDTGVDLHSYQPTTDDLLKISSCDVFVYVGGESDSWVDGALKSASGKSPVTVNLMEVLGDAVKEEETVEGMQGEDGEEAHREDEEHHHEEEAERDEHIWLSPKNAEKCVRAIADALCRADADNSETYKKCAEDYIAKLEKLDGEYKEAVENAKHRTVLFGDRFPFRYLTDEYGIEYYAAFLGCSAESEASFETVSFLSQKVKELDLKYVFTLEGSNHNLAETIIKNSGTDAEVISVDSMQSVTEKDVENGADYLSIMEKNLSAFKEALN